MRNRRIDDLCPIGSNLRSISNVHDVLIISWLVLRPTHLKVLLRIKEAEDRAEFALWDSVLLRVNQTIDKNSCMNSYYTRYIKTEERRREGGRKDGIERTTTNVFFVVWSAKVLHLKSHRNGSSQTGVNSVRFYSNTPPPHSISIGNSDVKHEFLPEIPLF